MELQEGQNVLINPRGSPGVPAHTSLGFRHTEQSFDISGYGAASGINKALPTLTVTNLLIKRGFVWVFFNLKARNGKQDRDNLQMVCVPKFSQFN